MTAAEKFHALAAKYAEVSATSPEGVAIALEMDSLKRDMAEERARTAPAAKSSRPWRGRVPEKTQREYRPRRTYAPRCPAPRSDHQAAAANERDDDELPFGGLA